MDEKRMDRLEEQIGAVREELGSFKAETSRELDALREEVRLNQVVRERLRSEMQALEEGVASMIERIDQYLSEVQFSLQEIRNIVSKIHLVAASSYR